MPKSQIILWLGLLMVVLQIVKDWPTIKATLFTPTTLSGGAPASGGSGNNSAVGGAIAGAGGSVLA